MGMWRVIWKNTLRPKRSGRERAMIHMDLTVDHWAVHLSIVEDSSCYGRQISCLCPISPLKQQPPHQDHFSYFPAIIPNKKKSTKKWPPFWWIDDPHSLPHLYWSPGTFKLVSAVLVKLRGWMDSPSKVPRTAKLPTHPGRVFSWSSMLVLQGSNHFFLDKWTQRLF